MLLINLTSSVRFVQTFTVCWLGGWWCYVLPVDVKWRSVTVTCCERYHDHLPPGLHFFQISITPPPRGYEPTSYTPLLFSESALDEMDPDAAPFWFVGNSAAISVVNFE